eukprot:scaffold223467_cov49-Prasinocladus_malaysianus.AAC.3
MPRPTRPTSSSSESLTAASALGNLSIQLSISRQNQVLCNRKLNRVMTDVFFVSTVVTID